MFGGCNYRQICERRSHEKIICEQRLERGEVVRLKNKYKCPAIG